MLVIMVALGGALGSVARYLLMGKIAKFLGSDFPYSTLIVNVSGSFLMGILIGLLAKTSFATHELRAFLAVGILGGYTTFSTFSLDILTLTERGDMKNAILYALLSVLLSVLSIFAGVIGVRSF